MVDTCKDDGCLQVTISRLINLYNNDYSSIIDVCVFVCPTIISLMKLSTDVSPVGGELEERQLGADLAQTRRDVQRQENGVRRLVLSYIYTRDFAAFLSICLINTHNEALSHTRWQYQSQV